MRRGLGAGLAGLALLACAGPALAAKRALLIGINEYASPDIPTLAGAVNDVRAMRQLLTTRFEFPPENVQVLEDGAATRAAILGAIRTHLIEKAVPGDVVVLHYSGHGSRMKDGEGASKDEPDGWDETLVPHDARSEGPYDISDDEINGLLRELSAKTPHVTLVFDSCHSGTIARTVEVGGVARQAPPDARDPPPPEPFSLGGAGRLESESDLRLPEARYVLVSGARADELSYEYGPAGQRSGTLTYFLVEALRRSGPGATWRDVVDEVAANVTSVRLAQHPQLEGAGRDSLVFGDTSAPADAFLLVEPLAGGEVRIEAGAVHGLAAGTILSVHPPGTKRFDAAPTAKVKVAEVSPFTAKGSVEEGEVQAHSRAEVPLLAPPGFRLGVWIDPADASALFAALRSRLASFDSMRLTERREDAEVRILREGTGVALRDSELEPLSRVENAGAPDAAEQIVTKLRHWARWYGLLALSNPASSLEVDLKIAREGVGADEPPGVLVAGRDAIEVTATNRSRQTLHLVLLDITSDGAVALIHPQAGAGDAVAPGASIKESFDAFLPEGLDSAVDTFKLVATTVPVPGEIFALQPLAREVIPPPAPGEDPLARYFREWNLGARHFTRSNPASWTTRQAQIRVVRDGPRVPTTERIALHFDSAGTARAVPRTLSESRAPCAPPNPDPSCVALEALPGEDTILLAELPAARVARGEAKRPSVGRAFDAAYALGDAAGAERAEPLFDIDLSGDDSRAFVARGGEARHDPEAKGDDRWSLKHARVPEAWAKVRAKTGRPAGAEASPITIAHPDTGYLPHPEIWNTDPALSVVLPAAGYDYYGDGKREDDDPLDDEVEDQPLDNPRHGTGSGSAIASPAGSQTPGRDKAPTGPALGAHLVPLRVHRSVVHFSTERMTRVILDASGTDRTRAKLPTQVMSISMGGVPSWALWKAVEKAERRGYLIVAAAGNYVRTVVWPARFDSVIAVAATNVRCEPWLHTSTGPAVEISAPGESLWRAAKNEDTGEATTGMGTGTTYATATTAGIAALWLAYYKTELEPLRAAGLVKSAFERAVREAYWRPDVAPVPGAHCTPGLPWVTSAMGPGIIDAKKLLEKPPEVPRAAGAAAADDAVDVESLPLFASLYASAPAVEAVRNDYGRLFLSPPGAAPNARFEAEVTHHYATSDAVRRELDAIALRGDLSQVAVQRAREALLGEDLSARLRSALVPAP